MRPGADSFIKNQKYGKRAQVRLEDQAQWVAVTSDRVLGALVRQQTEISRRHVQ